MKVLLVVNPTASSVTARSRVLITKVLAADHEVAVAETSRRGHASRLAQGAAADGTDVVVVLGGDGTLNEAANGLAGTPTALAPLPGGSTNVFSRTLGLPDDPVVAARVTADALAAGSIRPMGLGWVNGRAFLFHVGAGFDAAVVAQVERRGHLKRWLSHPLFVWATFDTAFRHVDRTRPAVEVHLPDGTVVDDAYVAVAFNSNPYTYLGSLALSFAPDAGLDRPLAMVAFRTLRVPTVMRLAASALRGGTSVARHPKVAARADLTSLAFRSSVPFPYQVDGDHLGSTTELNFTWQADAMSLVVPRPDGPGRARS